VLLSPAAGERKLVLAATERPTRDVAGFAGFGADPEFVPDIGGRVVVERPADLAAAHDWSSSSPYWTEA